MAQKEKEAGRKLTCCVHTFGCQMNARDSEKLLGILTDIGYVETEDENADFVIYNTCTVRENANNKVYGRLGYLSNFKKKNPHMMISLCGCMMQEPTVVEKIRKSYRFVDLVFGTHNIYKFAELLCNRLVSSSPVNPFISKSLIKSSYFPALLLWTNLTVSINNIFITGKCLKPHRTSGM